MSHVHRNCPRCGGKVHVPSRPWASVLVVFAWAYIVVSTFAAALLGPAIVGLLPVLIIGDACLARTVHERASAHPECLECGAWVVATPVARPRIPPQAHRIAV